MIGVTAEGQQAYALLAWANDDPVQRARQATERLVELATTLPYGSRPLMEVQDVGTVLARLAEAVRPAPVSMSGGILAQVLEFGHFDPARHPRDSHGRFTHTGGGLLSDVVKASTDLKGRSAPSVKAHDTASATARATAARNRAARAAARQTSVPETSAASDIDSIAANLQKEVDQIRQAHAAEPDPSQFVSKKDFDELVAKLEARGVDTEDSLKDIEKDQKEEQRAGLALNILSIAAGGALAFFMAHMGGAGEGGEGAAAAIGLVPFLVKTGIEKAPEIVKSLAEFHIAGKGKGREWFAHPIRKPATAVAAGARKAVPVARALPAVAKKAPAVAKHHGRLIASQLISQAGAASHLRQMP